MPKTAEKKIADKADAIDETPDREPTRAEIAKTLLDKYEVANGEVEAAAEKLKEAKTKSSNILKELSDKVGQGPYKHKGVMLGKIVARKDSLFFRGKISDSVIETE